MIPFGMTSAIPVVGVLDPQTVANTQLFTNVIDMSQLDQAMAIALLGNEVAETVDFACYTCASDGSAAVLFKAATQLAASATLNDNSQIVIGIRAEELAAVGTTGARYIKFGLVTGGSTGGPAAIVVIAIDDRYGPASLYNKASVKQVKTV